MLSRLMNMFRKDTIECDGSLVAFAQPQPTTLPKLATKGVHFDPVLIQHLRDDHRVILGRYGAIRGAAIRAFATDGSWAAVENELIQFRKGLTDHLMTESIKLYVYLLQTLGGDQENVRRVRAFSSEMAGIGKTVLDFIDKNRDVGLNADKQAQFLDAWGEIGQVLGDRISREERTLYPMYRVASSERHVLDVETV